MENIKERIFRILFIAWIVGIVAYAAQSIGTAASCEPFTWTIPVTMFGFMAITSSLAGAAVWEYYHERGKV